MTDLGEIKDILRSLAISCPRVMTVEDLRRDYRATENQECPYYALGYRNFTAFLQSIPDVITVLPNGVVRAVTTKETQHVQKLVNFQKKPKARSRGFSRSSSYSRSGPRKYAPAPRFSSAPPSKPVSQRPLNHPNPSSHRPALNQPMEQFFARVREVKEAARRDSIDSVTCQNVVNPSVEAGWSGVDFVHQWQEEHCGEDDSSCKRRVLVPDYESSEDSYDSFYERFKDHNEDPVDNIQGRLPTEVSTKDSGLDAYFQNESDAVSDKLKLNLRNLMKIHPSGFWACLLPEKYKEEYGVSLSWNELGFDSVVQMAHELPNIFLCKRVHGGDWMLFDASQPLPGEYTENVRKTSMKTDLSPDPVVPEYVKGKIYHIVRKFKGGIRAEQLTQLYCEHYGRTLHSDAPGFSDDESLYISIQNTVIYLRYIRNECYVYPEVNPESEQLDLPTLDVDTETKKRLGLYPEEVMGPGDKMKSPQLPANIEVGVYVELKVAEVYSPHKFWIILRESYGLLESLMDELQDFYRDHGSKYIMSDSTIVEGIYCTALYSGEWHRACVKSVHKNVEVFYVDYGTVHEVPRSELRFLHKDFCSLPCQAIRASLSLIQPSNGRQRFTREANQVFLNLVVEKFLIGVVQRVDSQEPFLELFLVDTNGENDVHLNDVLVNLEHASFKPGLLETTDNVVSSQDSQKVRETQETLAGGQSYAEPQADKQSRELKTVVLDPSNCQTGTNLPSYPDNVVFSTPLVHQGKVSNDIPSAPPPGFSNAIPPASSMNANSQGMLGYFMNPVLAAAYSPMYLQQMNAAALVQQQLQQQQQALLLAYYSNLYQQQSAALIAAQHVSPLQVQQKQQPPSFQITAQMQSTALSPSSEEVRQVTHNESLTSKLLSRETTGSIQKTASQHSFSNVSDSSSSDGCGKYATRRKKTSRRRTQENRPQTSLSSKIRTTRLFETDSDEASNIESSCNVGLPRNLVCPDVEKLNLNNEDFARAPVFSGTDDDLEIDHLNRLPKTGSQPGTLGEMSHAQDHHPSPHVISDDDDLEINHLSDLQAHTISSCLSSSTSSSRAAPPDLVQSVANLKVSSRVSTITNFWKVEEISGKTVHVFNINGKGYISTGELARKFTPFSTRDILVRVLNNKEIFACYKKLTRQEELPLFSALDGCDKEVVESFDLILQESGSVKGVFHLTSLINIPSMLISLNIDPFTAREFQRLRDKFDPNDCFWIT